MNSIVAIVLESLLLLMILSVLWAYLGYPVLLSVLARWRARRLIEASFEPTVSIIVSAYNEEKGIAPCLVECTDDGEHVPENPVFTVLRVVAEFDVIERKEYALLRQFPVPEPDEQLAAPVDARELRGDTLVQIDGHPIDALGQSCHADSFRHHAVNATLQPHVLVPYEIRQHDSSQQSSTVCTLQRRV